MNLNSRGTLDPETMDRIEQAMVEWASRELPKVWVGEPVRNEDGNLRGLKVDWYRLSEMNEELEGDLLPPHVEQELFEESMHVVAAKQELVTVKKFLPAREMTVQEEGALKLLEQSPADKSHLHHVRWGMNNDGSWPRVEESVREHVGMLFPLPPDERFPRGSAYLVRFVPSNALTRAHLPYIEDFLRKAADGPKQRTVEATDMAHFLASVLEDIDQS